MPFIGNQPALSYTSFAKQDFSTSATTSYTLDNPVANANELALFINFVRQEPTTSYSASGTTLTLTEATSSSDDMYCVYLGKAVQTVNPPNNSVDSSKINYPLTTFSSTGIDDNASSNAITIDSSQNIGIGTTSPDTAIDIAGTQPFINIQDTSGAGTGNEYGGITFESSNNNINAKISSKQDGGTSGGTISLWTQQYASGTGLHERLRVDDNGNTSMFRLNLNIPDASTTTNAIRFERNSSIDNDGDVRFVVFGSGNVQNSNNSYGAISDEKLKENIVNATPKLEKLKQVQVRSYNFKDEPDFKQIGVIAQELETVFPNMVEDIPDTDKKGNELGTSTKSVKYSVFVPILIKALQEANSKIEELETRIQTLENN